MTELWVLTILMRLTIDSGDVAITPHCRWVMSLETGDDKMKRSESSYVRQQSTKKPTPTPTLQIHSESCLSPYTAVKKKERPSGVTVPRQQNLRRPAASKPPFIFSQSIERKKDTNKTGVLTQKGSAQRPMLSPSNRLSNAATAPKVEDLQQELYEARYLNKYMKTIINLNKMEQLYEEEDMLSLILNMQSSEIHYLNALLNDMSLRTDQIADKCRKTEAELEVANIYLQQMKQINEGRHLESREKLSRRVATATAEMKDRDKQIEDLNRHLLLRRHWYIRQMESGRRGQNMALSFLPQHEQDKFNKIGPQYQSADSSILKRNIPDVSESIELQPGAKSVGFALSELYDSDNLLDVDLEDELEEYSKVDEGLEDQRGEVTMEENADEQSQGQVEDEPPQEQTGEVLEEQPDKQPEQQSEKSEGKLVEQREVQTEEQQGEQVEGLGEEQIEEQVKEPLEDPQEEKSTKAELQEPAKASASCFCEESPEASDSSDEKEPKVSTADVEANKKKIRTCESCMKKSEKQKKRRKRMKSKPPKYRDNR